MALVILKNSTLVRDGAGPEGAATVRVKRTPPRSVSFDPTNPNQARAAALLVKGNPLVLDYGSRPKPKKGKAKTAAASPSRLYQAPLGPSEQLLLDRSKK